MPERRLSDRRYHSIPEPLERESQRRGGDRRDSPRLPVQLEVHVAERECERARGDLSLGGASWVTERPPRTDDLVVTCRVPTLDREFAANARVVSRETHGTKTLVHVAFQALPLDLELALAKWLDERG